MQPQKTVTQRLKFPCEPCFKFCVSLMRVAYLREKSAHQNVVFSTMTFTVPGYLALRVKVSSTSIEAFDSSSSTSSSETSSSSHSSNDQGGDAADERKIPAAAACVSVGDDNAAERLFGDREERATRTAEGFDIRVVQREFQKSHCHMSQLIRFVAV